ncbi:MAG: oligosaccharide flippase family protein [Chloroflexota bacterium]
MDAEGELTVPFWTAARTLFGRSALYALAGAINKVLALVTVPLLTRLLTPEGYGLSDLAVGLAAMLTIVALFAADIPAAELVARHPASERRIYSTYVALVVGIGLLLGAGVFLAADLIANQLWNAPAAASLARWTAALIVATAARGSMITVFRLAGRAWRFAAISVLELVIELALSVWLVILGWGAEGVVAAYVVGNLVGLAASLVLGRDLFEIGVVRNAFRPLVVGGAWFLPVAMAFVIADYGLRYFATAFGEPAAVGHLAAASRIASVLSLASAGFYLAWGPYAVRRVKSSTSPAEIGRMMNVYGGAAIAGALIIGLFGAELIELIAGRSYRPGAVALPGLAAGAAIAGVAQIALLALRLSGRSRLMIGAAVGGGLVQVATAGALGKFIGLAGLGWATFAGQLATVGLALFAAGGAIQLPRANAALGALASALLVALVAMMSTVPAPIRVAAAVVVTVASVYWTVRQVRRAAAIESLDED